MPSKKKSLNEGNHTIHLQIISQPSATSSNLCEHGGSFFEPQREQSDPTPSRPRSIIDHGGSYLHQAPEKKLTLFALRLAVLEKAASGLGTLGFIWATVVLLGGFAVTLKNKDFWIVTAILIVEGTRIFSRSHELKWQQQATWSLAAAGRYSFRAIISSSRFLVQVIKATFRPFAVIKSDSQQGCRITENIQMLARKPALQPPANRTWRSPDVPMVPYAGWVLLSKNISKGLYWLQLLSAIACMALSLMRIIEQDYGEVKEGEENRKPALNVFYGLALAEALMFLLEKTYWEWKISISKLLDHVSRECDLGAEGIISIRRFFYDAYSSCINGSIFDGLKMDLVSFAEKLLDSDVRDEQLMGIRILQKFSISDKFSSQTLQKVGTSTSVIERLIEMLSWKNPAEEEIRRLAAEIVSLLSGKKQNAIRVAGISGSIECISSLLYTGRGADTKPYQILERRIVADQSNYEFSIFNLLGLQILKKLANNHDNCWKIGNSKGLLSQIINFTSAGERLLRNDQVTESQIKAVKRSLQLMKKLVRTTGHTGKMLRHEISDNVYTVSNIREILEYGENHMMLQMLAIEIVTGLAMDEDAREKIRRTGGVIKLLLSIFCQPRFTEDQDRVSVEAGEALAMLALDNSNNCDQILKEREVIERLVKLLTDKVLQINASRILRNLCTYSGPQSLHQLRGVVAAAPTVLKFIMGLEDERLEVSVGLATQIFRFMSIEEYHIELKRAGIPETNFVNKLLQILEKYNYPSIKAPRIRRFVLELAIWMMKSSEKYVQLFKDAGMEKMLQCIAETTYDVEVFSVFSRSVGLSRYKISLHSLLDVAQEVLPKG